MTATEMAQVATSKLAKFAILFAFLIPSGLFGQSVLLQWTDNSTNEAGFEIRGRLDGGAWEVVSKTASNSTEKEIDASQHDAWQVFAFNAWGYSGGTNVIEKNLPNGDPDGLRIKETVVTENIQKTTTTRYQ